MAVRHPLESDFAHLHPLLSWRSILAGLLIAFLSLAILLALGMAFGGIGLDDGSSAQNAGIFTGVWFLVSAIVSLFVGSYFAARVSKFHTGRIGSAQGLVISALFFGFFLVQTMTALGWAGSTATRTLGGASSLLAKGAQYASDSPVVRNAVEDSMGDLRLRQDPQTVLSGVVSRLVSGDTEGAKDYLAFQSGISRAEANARIETMRGKLDAAMTQGREKAAATLQAIGWTLFASLLLGSIAALSGGALGSRANFRKPLTIEQAERAGEIHGVMA